MKVLLIDETYPPDRRGSVPYPVDVVAALSKHGHTVDVLTVGDARCRQTEHHARGTVYRMARLADIASARLSIQVPPFLARRLRHYDLVHLCHPNPIGELSYLIAGRVGRRPPAVVSFHAEVVDVKPLGRTYNRIVTRNLVRLVDRVVVSSPPMLKTPSLEGMASKSVVIPYGIDVERRHRDHAQRRHTVAEPVGALRVLFVGRLARYKGVDVLLKALSLGPGVLRIVGDGPLRAALEERSRDLGVAGRASFLGRLPNEALEKEYSWADVLALPSVDEGEAFGYVLLEAMAQETALITTELGTGTSWVNHPGVTGLVVSPRDPNALAAALKVFARDRAFLSACQQAGLARARELFSLQGMERSTIDLYADVLRSRPI